MRRQKKHVKAKHEGFLISISWSCVMCRRLFLGHHRQPERVECFDFGTAGDLGSNRKGTWESITDSYRFERIRDLFWRFVGHPWLNLEGFGGSHLEISKSPGISLGKIWRNCHGILSRKYILEFPLGNLSHNISGKSLSEVFLGMSLGNLCEKPTSQPANQPTSQPANQPA